MRRWNSRDIFPRNTIELVDVLHGLNIPRDIRRLPMAEVTLGLPQCRECGGFSFINRYRFHEAKQLLTAVYMPIAFLQNLCCFYVDTSRNRAVIFTIQSVNYAHSTYTPNDTYYVSLVLGISRRTKHAIFPSWEIERSNKLSRLLGTYLLISSVSYIAQFSGTSS